MSKPKNDYYEVLPLGKKPLSFLKLHQGCLLSFVSAVIYSFSFEPFGCSLFAWFAVSLFYLASFRRQDKGLLLYGFIFSLTSLFFSNLFLYPVGWWIPFIVSFAYSFLVPLWLYFTRKLYWRLLFKPSDSVGDAEAGQFILSSKKEIIFVLCSSFLWCFFEWVRLWLYTGYPWDLLGVSQANNFSRFVASYGGVLLVSFVVILVNMTLAVWLEQRLIAWQSQQKFRQQFWAKLFCLMFSFLILFFCALKFEPSKGIKTVRVALLQGNFSPYERTMPSIILKTYKDLVQESLKANPQLYIWPETCIPYNRNFNNESYIKGIIDSTKSPHIIGFLDIDYTAEKRRVYNATKLYTYPYKDVQVYHKVHLVPFGEYIPFRSLIRGKVREFIESSSGMGASLDRGQEDKVFIVGDLRLGMQICFEDIFPDISRRLIYKNANALLVMSNDGWFKKTAGGRKHRTQAIFRAIETNLPLVRVGNHSESALISPEGKIVMSYEKQYKEEFGRGYVIVEVPIIENYQPTFYIRNPYFFVSLVILISSMVFFFLFANFVFYKQIAYKVIIKRDG